MLIGLIRPARKYWGRTMKLKPADRPRLSWRVPPSRKIITNGKISAPTIRPGSRTNFSRSREAIPATACRLRILCLFFLFACEDAEVGVLQSRRLRPQHCQRLVDGPHDLVRRPAVETDGEVAVLLEG